MAAVNVGWGLAWRWAAMYAVLCFVTQLWAGSQYSAGQGGGLGELVMWSAMFGVVAIVIAVERAINGSRVIDPGAAFVAAVVGQAVGAAMAIAWFTAKGGPTPGDWWIGPAIAALFVALWVHLLAPRTASSDEAGQQQ